MGQIQKCYVCGRAGLFVEDHIQVIPGDRSGPGLIGQCPRCHRFVCSRHGEALDLSGQKRLPWQRARVLTVCCPFDPGIPLGTAD